MKCDIKIMGVVERIDNIQFLVDKLHLNIKKDVFLGELSHKDIIETSIGALTLPVKKGITHRVILQDDVDVCDDFENVVNKLITQFPDDMFSLYLHDERIRSLPYGSVVEINPHQMKGQGIIFPLSIVKRLFLDKLNFFKSCYEDDDSYYGSMCFINSQRVLTTAPSLVHLKETTSLYKKSFNFRDIWYLKKFENIEFIDSTSSTECKFGE